MLSELPPEIRAAIVQHCSRKALGALGLTCKALADSIRLTVDSLETEEVEGWNLVRFSNVKRLVLRLERTPVELWEAPSICSGLRELKVVTELGTAWAKTLGLGLRTTAHGGYLFPSIYSQLVV